jgi:hypothetical protein
LLSLAKKHHVCRQFSIGTIPGIPKTVQINAGLRHKSAFVGFYTQAYMVGFVRQHPSYFTEIKYQAYLLTNSSILACHRIPLSAIAARTPSITWGLAWPLERKNDAPLVNLKKNITEHPRFFLSKYRHFKAFLIKNRQSHLSPIDCHRFTPVSLQCKFSSSSSTQDFLPPLRSSPCF